MLDLQFTKCDLENEFCEVDGWGRGEKRQIPSRTRYPSSCFYRTPEHDQFHAIDDGGTRCAANERLNEGFEDVHGVWQ
jgi:hypothetical protein